MLKWISNFVNCFEIVKLKEENERLQHVINHLENDMDYMIEKIQKFSNYDSLAAHILHGGNSDRQNY